MNVLILIAAVVAPFIVMVVMRRYFDAIEEQEIMEGLVVNWIQKRSSR